MNGGFLLQENVWWFLLGGPKKVAAIRSLLYCRDGRKAGFQFSQGSFLIYKFCLLLVFRNINQIFIHMHNITHILYMYSKASAINRIHTKFFSLFFIQFSVFLATVLHIISVTDCPLFFTYVQKCHILPRQNVPAKLAEDYRLIHPSLLHTPALPPNRDAKCWAAQSKFSQNFHY